MLGSTSNVYFNFTLTLNNVMSKGVQKELHSLKGVILSIPLNKNLNTDILSWLKTDITYHLKNSLNLIFLCVFRISVFLPYFENRWNLKYSPLASMIFIHNVLHQMMMLLEVEQDSKEAYKKLQCQQKIYISRK